MSSRTSSPARWHRLAGLFASLVVASLPALTACGSSAASGFLASGSSSGGSGDDAGSGAPSPYADGGEPDSYSYAATEAAPAVMAYQGSPLCNASQVTSCCYPDALSLCAPTACEAPSDAGAADGPGGFASQVAFGCHLAPSPTSAGDAGAALASGQQVAPACLPAGLGVDGAPCRAPADCAPGYECVGSDGTCRHYCCAGSIACLHDQFCDIQQTTQSAPMNVPVCMPVETCALLESGACPAGETCAVVREDGSKSCVAVGSAAAGDRCETVHCGAGLVCLGVPGSRLCYSLCAMKVPGQCPSTQTCKGGLPLFLDPGVGICE
jgi:hypothetical protein